MIRVVGLFCLAKILGALACSQPDQPGKETESLPPRDVMAPIQTDTTSYLLRQDDLGWGTEIEFQFRNAAADTIYAVNCNGAFTVGVERKEGADWNTFWAPETNSCLSPPLIIRPGGTFSAPLALWGAAPGSNVGPQFSDTTFGGVYRLVWWNLLFHYDLNRRELGDSVPVQYRFSNDFRLRNQTTKLAARETDVPEAHLARLKEVIRQDTVTSYGAECGTIGIPEDAFIPVEITGGGLPELAVTFGRIQCGLGRTRFSGTGGVMVQFWIGSGGPVRLLLEQQMHGFTPAGDRLITMQHGGYCPDGAGPDQCRVIYRWNDRDRRLEVAERRLASNLDRVEDMAYDWSTLSR